MGDRIQYPKNEGRGFRGEDPGRGSYFYDPFAKRDSGERGGYQRDLDGFNRNIRALRRQIASTPFCD